MEQHPVPQNIIEVEFKLFGSFTLKQFSKIIIGCLAGVVIYFLPIIPFIIKVPLILVAVGVGILSALIQNFGVWLNGFVKALFISPRYVWIKHETTPELLKAKQSKNIEKAQKVATLQNKTKVDITDVSMDKLFGSKADTQEYVDLETNDEYDPVRNSNLDRLYSQAFASGAPRAPQQAQIQNQQQLSVPPSQMQRPLTIQDFQNQIAQLKFELSRLNKDSNSQQRQQEIMSRINDLYSEVKLLQTPEPMIPQNHPMQSTVTRSRNVIVSQVERTTKTVFGIVVDKKDSPISRAGINFENIEDGNTYHAISSPDGRFATQEIPIGKYNVTIEQPGYKFHTYQIDIKDQKLPAYKFRER